MFEEVELALERTRVIFTAIEDVIQNDWNKSDTLPFPVLLKKVLTKLGDGDFPPASIDALIRNYIRGHSLYCSSRGARGGVVPRAVRDQRRVEKETSEATKAAIKAQLDSKLTTTPASTQSAAERSANAA
jgi:hypothetical protein